MGQTGDDQIREIAYQMAEKYELTKAEGSILYHVLKGLNNKEIGESVYISEKTVKNHVAAILAKTETNSRSEVQAIAMRKLSEKYIETADDLNSIYDKWTSLHTEIDKRKSRKSSHLQHPEEKYLTKKDSTKYLDKKQSEQMFGERGGDGE